ncbi:dipeptide ABC transporter ATP-binding protein [Desulfobacterales bacterium HSG2]|nr:dipeptide ABC transporter ATP-binding protein [Desulfobacterales bacterium HSG2]
MSKEIILDIKNLVTAFDTESGRIRAVDDVSFQVKKGQTLGIVGESGCGKSVTSLSIMRLLPKPAGVIESGQILFRDIDIARIDANKMHKIRGNRISMIFQEPMTALNPVHRIGKQIGEVFRLHYPEMEKKDIRKESVEILRKVGIPDPEKRIEEYPHQISGGMRQRIMIAMALVCKPDILIADEPTTALDVTIQAQILELMKALQRETGMTIIFITHDLGVIAEICDEVVVMYAGKLAETAPIKELFSHPKHPYTAGLLSSIPRLENPRKAKMNVIRGMVPSLHELPEGCRFQNRCPKAEAICKTEPEMKSVGKDHFVSCQLTVDGLRFTVDSCQLPVADLRFTVDGLRFTVDSCQLPVADCQLTPNRKPSTANRQPQTANRQPQTANRQPQTVNRQPSTVNRQPSTVNRQPPTANRQPSTVNCLEVRNLKMHFPIYGGVLWRRIGTVYAVDGISLKVRTGETLGLVGESGCGKTTVGRAILRIYDPTDGDVLFGGKNMSLLRRKALRNLRRNLQMIFQDPFESLNSRQTIGDIIEEPFIIHGVGDPGERKAKVEELMNRVGISRDAVDRFPHEFSGGQRQRVGIARAIALEPKLIICDEPVSALDVSIQSQVLNLLMDLQEEMRLTYLFIAHDLAVVRHISDHIAVMYLGRIVEYTDADTIYEKPLHPYTRTLISAIPVPDPAIRKEKQVLVGDVPSPIHPPSGCRFHTRCPVAMDHCKIEEPELCPAPGTDGEAHLVACHRMG